MRNSSNDHFSFSASAKRAGELRWPVTGLAILVALLPTLVIANGILAGRTSHSLRQASTLVIDQQYAKAMSQLQNLSEAMREKPIAQILKARAMAGLGDNDEALTIYQQIHPREPFTQLEKAHGIGSRLLSIGQMKNAEPWLRKALSLNPCHTKTLRLLSRALQLQGRVWESQSLVWQLLVQDEFKGDDLYMLGTSQEFLSDHSLVERSRRLAPDDLLPLLGPARQMFMRNEIEESESLLRRIILSEPQISEAQVALGRILLDRDDDDAFLKWHRDLASSHDKHPELWLLRGLWLRRSGYHEQAVRCFLETIERFPNHVEANYQLSQSLATLGHREFAEAAGVRSRQLAQIELSLAEFRGDPTVPVMRKLAKQLADLTRYWEAAALCCLAERSMPSVATWAHEDLLKYSRNLQDDHTVAIAQTNGIPIEDLIRDDFPLPSSWHFEKRKTGQTGQQNSTDVTGNVRFIENAQGVGFDFTFYNGSVTAKGLEHIFETTGGGIAILDFDGDLFPDIWAAQGSDIWTESQNRTDLDQLFRNIDGKRYVNATHSAIIEEDRFSQGVAAGDLNNDGFPDVFVANQGINRLYINNGDGTFSDVTETSGLSGRVWSMSAAIVDLNQDSVPDIYEVNYLKIDSVLKRRCKSNGQPLTCAPTLFTAEQDKLWLGNGDGTYSEHSGESGIVQPEGKGLGLIAADFDNTGRISVFVGNDTTNNFFFRNITPQPGAAPQFEEQGLISGLAADGEGRAQATMGIAFGDADSDGLADIFTTNFYADPNSLLLQQGDAYFIDQSRDSGIYDSGYNLLGFGAQFVDADLDGRPDILVTNGHVDRTSATGEPDEMPPQFFRNVGGGKFVEPAPEDTGPFFSRQLLGRALSTLDWNRDGRNDAAISHLYSPAALVTNSTATGAKSLTVSLIGQALDRDGNGTKVSIAASPDWPAQTQQLCAGNGYLSTNERILIFAIPQDAERVHLAVKWPDKKTQEFNLPSSSGHIRIIESETTAAFKLPH